MKIDKENNSAERKEYEPKRCEQAKKLQPFLHSGCEDTKPMNYCTAGTIDCTQSQN